MSSTTLLPTKRDRAARRRGVILAAAALLAPAAGCAGTAQPPQLSAADTATLHRDVQAIRSAVEANKPQTAHAAANALRSDVSSISSRGALEPADAHALLVAIGRTDARVTIEAQQVAPPGVGSTAPASPLASPPPPARGPNNGAVNGDAKPKDKGQGSGGGEGGD